MRKLPPRLMLYIASAALLATTAVTLSMYGGRAYFLTFHRPFGLSWPYVYHAPMVPKFAVASQINAVWVPVGGTERVHMSITPLATAAGHIDVWVEGPDNTQVFRSAAGDSPVQFRQGVTMDVDYAVKVAASWPQGTYKVGEIITSANRQTDYYVKPDIEEFVVR